LADNCNVRIVCANILRISNGIDSNCLGYRSSEKKKDKHDRTYIFPASIFEISSTSVNSVSIIEADDVMVSKET
jgi:hypothetical protein